MTPTTAIRIGYFGTVSAVLTYTTISGMIHMRKQRFERKVAELAAPELAATAYATTIIKEMIAEGLYTHKDPAEMLKDFEGLRKLHLSHQTKL